MSIYISDEFNSLSPGFNIDKDDPTLNGSGFRSFQEKFSLSVDMLNELFLSQYHLGYITEYAGNKNIPIQIVTHPENTKTCYEKSQMIGNWDPLNVIKALYFESSTDQCLYVVVVPETGCFLDRKYLSSLLQLPDGMSLAKARELPENMAYGTCSPFITYADLQNNGGRVVKIIFDSETLIAKKHDVSLDDFSFGLDHRLSLQMNYYHCYKMLKSLFGNVVLAEDILTLSFTEKFQRKNGKVKVNYDFKSLNFRTAKFMNSIHGVGDVVVENDYVDELDLPDVLISC